MPSLVSNFTRKFTEVVVSLQSYRVFWPFHKCHVKSPRCLSRNSQKSFEMSQIFFLNLSKKHLRVRFFKKIQDWILKSEGIRKRIYTDQSKISRIMARQRNRRIHSGSGFFGSFDAPSSEKSWIDLFSKKTQNPFSDSFGFKNPILPDFLKETHPKYVLFLLEK